MKVGVTMGLKVLLLQVLCQFDIISADGSNMRWGVTAGQMLLLQVLPQLAGGSECTQAQMVSILGRCALVTFCHSFSVLTMNVSIITILIGTFSPHLATRDI